MSLIEMFILSFNVLDAYIMVLASLLMYNLVC